jgi:divalent metal cation (Fe/Co/Zn/Cd) transporter
MARSASSKTVWAAVIGNLPVAITKIGAAAFSGSSAMVSEAVHSVVDTGNEVLLLYGMRRSRRRPDTEHPFGYGRELYLWSFIGALLLFGLGCIASLVEGIDHIRHPQPIEHPGLIYIVLVLSFLFEGSSWLIARKGFRPSVGVSTRIQSFRRRCSRSPRATVGVVGPNGLVSAQLAPDQVVVALSVQFEDRLTTPEIERIVVEMEDKIRRTQPQVFVLYVKPQSPEAFAAAQKRLRG